MLIAQHWPWPWWCVTWWLALLLLFRCSLYTCYSCHVFSIDVCCVVVGDYCCNMTNNDVEFVFARCNFDVFVKHVHQFSCIVLEQTLTILLEHRATVNPTLYCNVLSPHKEEANKLKACNKRSSQATRLAIQLTTGFKRCTSAAVYKGKAKHMCRCVYVEI